MLPENLVLDESASPKDLVELEELAATRFRTDHVQTTLQEIQVRPDGTVQTPAGELRVTRYFLEGMAKIIGMPLGYAYKITPELACENLAQRTRHATNPITVCHVGDIATALVVDRCRRYRPAKSAPILNALQQLKGMTLKRATIGFDGFLVELVKSGCVVEPVPGDAIELGVAVSNSEIGLRHPKASAYSFRLVCTNGAILSDRWQVARWANDPRMTDAGCLRQFTREIGEMAEIVNGFGRAYESVIDRQVPDVELVNLWRRVHYALPDDLNADRILGLTPEHRRELQDQVRMRRPNDPHALTEESVYDLHNRITHAAHEHRFRIRRDLQEIGGELLDRSRHWLDETQLN